MYRKMKKMKNWDQFLNEDETILPTQDMINWINVEERHLDDWDELDRDVEMDRIRNDFFDFFESDLKGHDKWDVWNRIH